MYIQFSLDCTGSSTAAIKWLSVLPDPVIVPKQVHDPKMRYTNCEYIVDPAIMEKVDFPGGYANASMIYLFHPDYRMEHRTLLIWKREHNAREPSVLIWIFVFMLILTQFNLFVADGI